MVRFAFFYVQPALLHLCQVTAYAFASMLFCVLCARAVDEVTRSLIYNCWVTAVAEQRSFLYVANSHPSGPPIISPASVHPVKPVGQPASPPAGKCQTGMHCRVQSVSSQPTATASTPSEPLGTHLYRVACRTDVEHTQRGSSSRWIVSRCVVPQWHAQVAIKQAECYSAATGCAT